MNDIGNYDETEEFESARPGRHAVIVCDETDVVTEGIRLRSLGWEIRDTVSILSKRLSLAILVRKKMEGTIASSLIRRSTGVLDIDGSRVNSNGSHKRPKQPTNTERSVYSGHDEFVPTNADGRFPPNTVLVHLDGCTRDGRKRIEPKEGYRPNPVSEQSDRRIVFNEKPEGYQKVSYTRDDGTEEVDNWDCVEGCPVAKLDEQSGERLGCAHPSDASTESIYRPDQGEYQSHGYEGSASRFYPQFGSNDELLEWLSCLIGSRYLVLDHRRRSG